MNQATRPTEAPKLPFHSRCTPDFAQLLLDHGSSLAFSTYKSGKVVILSACDTGLVQLPRNFVKPMGLVVDGDRMAVAARDEIIVLGNARALAPHYPENPGTYDHLWTPRASYYSGNLDTHDIAWAGSQLIGVNTRFSCLSAFGERYSFDPIWQPPFVSSLVPEDRCHLNGLAMDGDAPAYVTALGATDEPRGWRDNRVTGGVLVHVPSNEIVLTGLCMPHSPRLIEGELFLLNSGKGEVLRCDPKRGTTVVLCRLPGFVRGLAVLGDYLVVGMSMLRDTRNFGGLPLESMVGDLKCGVALIHRTTGKVAGTFYYESDCEELYDVVVMGGMQRPGIISVQGDLHRRAIHAPEFLAWTETRKPQAQEGTPPGNPYLDAIQGRTKK